MIRQCCKDDRPFIKEKLIKHEPYAMSASHYFLTQINSEKSFFTDNTNLYFFPGDGRFIPLIENPDIFLSIIKHPMMQIMLPNVRGIFGQTKWIEAAKSHIPRPIIHDQAYETLLWTREKNQPSWPEDVFIVSQKELNKLFPLQWEYEKEELQIKGISYSKRQSYKVFHKNHQNFIYLATKNKEGKFLAKGATNAHGLNYLQVGGIFTHKSQRRKGFAQKILEGLQFLAKNNDQDSCLFVKTHNLEAKELYQKAGFNKTGDFTIIYFN